MGDPEPLACGPPIGRRPLPQPPQPQPPNRSADFGTDRHESRPPCPPLRSESMEKWQPLNLTKPAESSVKKSSFNKREKPVITVLDARPMDQVGFRGVQAISPKQPIQNKSYEEPVKMRPPPPGRSPAPSTNRRSIPINMDKFGFSTVDSSFSENKPLPPRPNQQLITSTSYTNDAFNDKPHNDSQNCDAADARISNINNSRNIENKIVPDLIAGQEINAPQKSVDLLIDVPPPTQAPHRSPPHRGVPVLSIKKPLPVNRGPPPPLPKKSPSVPNLFTMHGDANWSLSTPMHIETEDDSGVDTAEPSQPSPVPRVPRTPTIIRVPRPTSTGHVTEQTPEVHQNYERTNTDAAEANTDMKSGNVKSLSDKISGGVRVFPCAIPKSTSEHSTLSESHTKPMVKAKTNFPPMIKPKPALLPKPALRPKPTTAAKPTIRPQSAAFASSLKFAQMLDGSKPSVEATPKPRVHSTHKVQTSHTNEINENTENDLKLEEKEKKEVSSYVFVKQRSIQSDISAHENVPKKGPMKATYRPTIIRAAVKAKEPSIEPTKEVVQEFAPINKRLSSSCLNMSTKSGGNFSSVEFNNNEWNGPSTETEKAKTPPQAAKRRQPTIIRPRAMATPNMQITEPTQEQQSPESARKSVSFASPQAEPTKNRSGLFGVSILKGAMSMPDISGKSSGKPPPRPGAPPSRPGSRTSSVADSFSPPMSPISPVRRDSNSTPMIPMNPVRRDSNPTPMSPMNPVRRDSNPTPPDSPANVKKWPSPPNSPANTKKGPPPRPSDGPKRSPRPSSGPTRRASSSAGNRHCGPVAADRRHSSDAPSLPNRPGPGHPLYHYVAQGPHAVALFDYDAQQPDELSFQVGAVIELVRQNNAEWLTGRSANQEGIFPVSFVDIIEPLPADLVNLHPKTSTEQTDPTSHDEGYGPRCRARFDYEGPEPEDLDFTAGDIITLFEHVGGDWLKGELRGKVGIFPLSFVEILQDVEEAVDDEVAPPPLPSTPIPECTPTLPTWADQPVEKEIHICTAVHEFSGQEGELSFHAGAKIHVISRLNEEWLHGSLGTSEGSFPASFIDNIPANLPKCEVKQQSSTVVSDSKPVADSTPLSLSVNTQQVKESAEFGVVTFAFAGESEGDLDLNVGEKVQILEHMGDEWLKGKVGHREGVFPSAFVELLSPNCSPSGPSSKQSILSPTLSLHSQPHNEPATVSEPHDEPSIQPSGTKATVLHDFDGLEEGDLSVKAGDEVWIIDTAGDDWLRGRINDREGIFPASFVEVDA